MPSFPGKFLHRDAAGAVLAQGPCQLAFDEETCTVTPSSGPPLAFDLGDVDRATSGEWDLSLTLYTGVSIELRQFGAAFSDMARELVAAWRDRTVRCLLLEDLEEIERFTATAALETATPSASEVRLLKSNLVVLPTAGVPFQWRLAELDAVSFDPATWAVTLQSGARRLVLTKLAKRTDEFVAKIRAAVDGVRSHAADALQEVFPFLDAGKLQRLVTVLPEGRSVRLAALAAIDPRIPEALVARAVDEPLRPYFDALRSRAVADSLMAGFKLLRLDEEDEPASGEDKQPLFFWFFFPMAAPGRPGSYANAAAWEATTGSGRATYFFRLVPPGEEAALSDARRAPAIAEAAIAELTRGLAVVNFRREPIYLPDESLERQPRFQRYAIGCRKLPELRALRASLLGRAIHSSLDEWTEQVSNM